MAGPVAGGELGPRSIDRAALEPDGDADAEKHQVSDRAMDSVVGEAVSGIVTPLQARISTEDIEEVPRASEIDDQTAASHRDGRIRAARFRRGLLVAKVELE